MFHRFRLYTSSLVALFTVSAFTFADDKPQSKPATLVEIRDAVDWSKMPKPPGSQAGRIGLSNCSYKAPGTFPEAAAFFREQWPTLGWKEDATPIPGVDQKDSLYLSFDKGDMRITVNGYRSDPKGPMNITLSLYGNVDQRAYPKPADAKFLSNARTAAFFTTGLAPKEAIEFCRKAILEKGWKEVPVETAAFFAKEGRFVHEFHQNAMQIGLVAAKDMTGVTEVSFSVSVKNTLPPADIRSALTPKEMAVPGTEKEYLSVIDLRKFPLMKGAKKQARQSEAMARPHQIYYQAPATLDEAVEWHRKEFLANGFKETLFDSIVGDRVEMHFEKQGYLVKAGFRKPRMEELQISVVNYGNVDLRQLPYPAGTEISPERTTFINALTTASESDALAFFRKELKALKWTEIKGRGTASYEFFQAASHLHIELQKNNEGRTAFKISQSVFTMEKDKE